MARPLVVTRKELAQLNLGQDLTAERDPIQIAELTRRRVAGKKAREQGAGFEQWVEEASTMYARREQGILRKLSPRLGGFTRMKNPRDRYDGEKLYARILGVGPADFTGSLRLLDADGDRVDTHVEFDCKRIGRERSFRVLPRERHQVDELLKAEPYGRSGYLLLTQDPELVFLLEGRPRLLALQRGESCKICECKGGKLTRAFLPWLALTPLPAVARGERPYLPVLELFDESRAFETRRARARRTPSTEAV